MKKILALLLILSLVLGSALCASAEGLEMSDIPGMTAAGVLPIVTEPVTITFAFAPNAAVSDFHDNKWTLWLEENTGITIDFMALPSENPGQKLELMIASHEKLADVIDGNRISNANLYNYYIDGILLPLDEYAEKYSFYLQELIDNYYEGGNTEWDNIIALCRTFDGAWLKFPSTYCDPTNRFNPGSVLWLRDDWVAQWNADGKSPETVDELYDFLVFCRDNDVNGNGDPSDEIGLVGGTGAILNAFCTYSKWQDAYINVDADGNVFMPQVTDNYKHALEYLNKLYTEGLLSSQAFTADSAQLKAICTVDDPKEAIAAGFQNHPTSFLDSPVYRNQYNFAWPLTSDEYPLHYIEVPQYQSSTMIITSDSEHPEVAFRLLDYTCEYETMIRSRWGAPGEDFEWIDDPENYEPLYPWSGAPVIYKVINNPWAIHPSNMIWKIDRFPNLPAILMAARPSTTIYDPEDPDYDADKAGYSLKSIGLQALAHEDGGATSPEQTQTIIYTEDEENEIMDIANSIVTYVEECQTRFILGEMDIANEWDSYIATIDAIGYEEYMKVVQDAYDRMYK